MKKEMIAGLLLILVLIVGVNNFRDRGTTFQARTNPPQTTEVNGKYYYDQQMNPFFPEYAPSSKYVKSQKGYITGNCTWYAWGRVCEITGKKLSNVFTGSAAQWWKQNKEKGYYPYGQRPKVGAIACYKTHVAVVEKIGADGTIKVSESGWKVEPVRSEMNFNYGTPWRGEKELVGYIYVK